MQGEVQESVVPQLQGRSCSQQNEQIRQAVEEVDEEDLDEDFDEEGK